MKILIFRTDRVGDFILSSILINSIKKNIKNAEIHVIASIKNFNFIKNSTLVNKAHILLQKNITNIFNIVRILNQTTFDYIIVADGKDRSIFLSLLIKCKFRIINIRKKLFFFLNFFKKNLIIYDNEKEFNKLDIIKKNLFLLNIKFKNSDLDIFHNRNKLIHLSKKFQTLSLKKYILFHFDEKWIFDNYIKSYTSIEPSLEQLQKLINDISLNTNKDIVITNGKIENILFNKLKDYFTKIENNLYFTQINSNKIILIDNTNLEELIDIIAISDLIITCHGAPTHIASSFNVKIIDIIEKNKKKFYNIYTSHLRNYNLIYRKSFNELSKEIIALLA